MATQKEKRREIFEHWNSKKIVVHKRLTSDLELAIAKVLKDYPVEEVKELIDFYATILEVGVPEAEQKYFWTYRWGLKEFLMRGVPKFDGQSPDNYLRKQKVEGPEAIIFKRK